MRALAYQACKIGTLLLLIFMIPIAVELREILRIWLKNPPQYTDGLCRSVMAMVIIDKTSVGHMLAVNARGKIAVYQAFLGGALLLTLPIAWALVHYGWNVYAVGYSLVITMAMCAWGRVWFARRLVGMSARYWLLYIFLPLFVVAVITVGIGLLPRLFMNTSFVRVLVSGLLVETVLVVLSWLILLNKEERNFVISKLKGLF
jgi:hypothetical protein